MEQIGDNCFYCSGIKEITLRGTPKEISINMFANFSPKIIWVEEDSALNVKKYVGDSVKVLLVNETRVWGELLWDLRQLSEVVIPEGVEEIEGFWFSWSGIESVSISRSVRIIEQGAFYKCEKLKKVSFQQGSRLEKIGAECFAKSGLKEIVLPESVREVGAKAFWLCE